MAEAESVAQQVGAELQQYLSQRLALVADDVRADLTAAITAFSGGEGSAGRTGRRLGLGLEAGSGLLSIGSGGAADRGGPATSGTRSDGPFSRSA